jgi:hypothetical protein
MNTPTRAAVLGAACVLGVCARFDAPSVVTELLADVWAMPGVRRQLDRDRARWEVLHQKEQAAKRRIELKSALTRELIAGRTTLGEVAARFRDIDATHPASLEIIRANHPGRGDGERYCRTVIDHVASRLHQEPSLAAEVTARLEADLNDRLSRPGDVELP